MAVGSSPLPKSSSWTEGAVVSEGAPRDSDDARECREDPVDEFDDDSVRSVNLRLMAAIASGMIYW